LPNSLPIAIRVEAVGRHLKPYDSAKSGNSKDKVSNRLHPLELVGRLNVGDFSLHKLIYKHQVSQV